MNYIKNDHKYPYLTDLINNGGGLTMTYLDEKKTTAVAFDEYGAIWKGKESYDSIEALLNDAETGIKKWTEEYGE
jgi:hypothetical protein